MNFDQSFELLIDTEKGYTNDPRDRGNWDSGQCGVGECKGTKYGISAAQYPLEDIANMNLDRAKFLYKRDYWDKLKCDMLPSSISFDMFDMGVNSGVKNAAITLQKTVQFLQDGIIGKQTLDAVHAMEKELLDKRFNANRLLFICAIPTFPTYGKGWVKRVAFNMLRD